MDTMEIVKGTIRDAVRTATLAAGQAGGGLGGALVSRKMITDPYPIYRRLRETGPTLLTAMGPVTGRYDVIQAVLRHPSVLTGTSRRQEILASGNRFQRWLYSTPDRPDLISPIGRESMIGMDGADHARIRRLVSAVFTPAAIERLRPRLTAIAEELVDAARAEPEFDLMSRVAGILPVRAICEILGIPATDVVRFRQWGTDIAADLDAIVPAARQRAATRSLAAMQRYFAELFVQRRHNLGDDMLSRLITVTDEGDRLTDRELMATCNLLLFAGFETTVNLIGNGTQALIEHPDQLELLCADPALIPGAVEELLRYDAPIQLAARVTTTELEVAGTVLPPDTAVSLFLGAANRDPSVFTEPDRLDVRRDNARRHLSFAAGPHHCLGSALARLEGEITFTTLLDRLGDLRPAAPPTRRPTFILRGLKSLPLRSHP